MESFESTECPVVLRLSLNPSETVTDRDLTMIIVNGIICLFPNIASNAILLMIVIREPLDGSKMESI